MKKILMLLPVVAFLSACSPQMMEAVRTGVVQGVNQGLNNASNGYNAYNGNPYNTSASDGDCYEPYNECLLHSRDITPCGNMFDQCKANRQMIAPGENARALANASYEAKKECDLERQSCRIGNSMRGWNNEDGECDYRWRQCLKNHQ